MKIFYKMGFLAALLFPMIILSTTVVLAAPPDHARGGGPGRTSGLLNGSVWTPPGLIGKGIPPGLWDKGGLPPGLHGRETLPPGIMMRFAEALERDEEEAAYTVLQLSGPQSVAIPAEGSVEVEYSAMLVSGGAQSTVSPTWALEGDVPGVQMSAGGKLTVHSEAAKGILEIIATHAVEVEGDYVEFSAALDVELYVPEAGSVTVLGAEFVQISGGEGGDIALSYSAVVEDQKGALLEGMEVEWTFVSGDFLDPLNGYTGLEVNFALEAKPGAFTLTASAYGIEDSLEVHVYIPEATSISIDGNALVAVVGDEDAPLTLTYTATVMDQQGVAIEGYLVDWSIDPEVPGVTVANGDVTIAEVPEEDLSFTLIAAYGDIEQQLAVTLYLPMASNIHIAGPNRILLPEGADPVSEQYTAAVVDQHGETLVDAEVVWIIADASGEPLELNGLDVDATGLVTVTDEAEEATFYLYAVYSEYVFDVLEVTLVAQEPAE